MSYPPTESQTRLGQDLCRSVLLEFIYQQDQLPKGVIPIGNQTYDLAEGCRHFLNNGYTSQESGGHPAGEAYDDYRDFGRINLQREFGTTLPKDYFSKEQLESIGYGEYEYYPAEDELDPIVTVDRNSIEVSDIINGQRVSRRYIGYSEDEALEQFMDDITMGGI